MMVESVRDKAMITVNSVDEIPKFQDEAEEAEFWANHEWSDELYETQAEEPPPELLPRARTKPVSLRLDEDTIQRTKLIGQGRQMGYQTLMKLWISQRLYEEERISGLFGPSLTGGESIRHNERVVGPNEQPNQS
jgi:CopG antitoxin of type II toxin-antitoxin system